VWFVLFFLKPSTLRDVRLISLSRSAFETDEGEFDPV